MAIKRAGVGGNISRDPRGNLTAQKAYIEKFGELVKTCSGVLHNDGSKVPITNFRQAKNSASFLQGRCDLCNRLYFSTLQKPKFRILPILIYAEQSGKSDWRENCPESLKAPLERTLKHFLSTNCKSPKCPYDFPHGDLRESMAFLTKLLSGLEKLPKDSPFIDERSGARYMIPSPIAELSAWAGKTGSLYKQFQTNKVWSWWVKKYPLDLAKSSDEENEEKRDPNFQAPFHPLSDFSWGAGNLKDTNLFHTVPAFNKVRSSKTVLVGKTSLGNRAYGYLAEGDHQAMATFGNKCKRMKLSLGHTPAPLRWLGKNDPINAVPEKLSENIQKRDSLDELHAIAIANPNLAGTYVSWQVRERVVELGQNQVSKEAFTTQIQASVEAYFDDLLDSHLGGDKTAIWQDLNKADPGQTQIMYEYRYAKVVEFLVSRPRARVNQSNKPASKPTA
jgi:hypothetical protein